MGIFIYTLMNWVFLFIIKWIGYLDLPGSVKSPPGGETAPTIVMEPSLSGDPRQVTLPALS